MIWYKIIITILVILYMLFIWATWTLLFYFIRGEYQNFPNKKRIDLALTLLSVFWPVTVTAVLVQVVVFNIKRVCKRSK